VDFSVALLVRRGDQAPLIVLASGLTSLCDTTTRKSLRAATKAFFSSLLVPDRPPLPPLRNTVTGLVWSGTPAGSRVVEYCGSTVICQRRARDRRPAQPPVGNGVTRGGRRRWWCRRSKPSWRRRSDDRGGGGGGSGRGGGGGDCVGRRGRGWWGGDGDSIDAGRAHPRLCRRHRWRFCPPAIGGYFLATSWRHPHSVCRPEVANGGYWEDETNAPKEHLAIQKHSHVAHLFACQNL